MKKTSAVAIMLAAIFVSSVVTYATIQYTRTIGNNAGVKTAWNVQLWRMDASYVNPQEMITLIQWPDLDPATTFTTNQLYGTCLKLKNTGNSLIYVAWELSPATPLPSGVTLTARYAITTSTWIDLAQLDFNTISIEPGQFSGTTLDPNVGRIEFKLTIDAYATSGPFSFNILLHAADTNAG